MVRMVNCSKATARLPLRSMAAAIASRRSKRACAATAIHMIAMAARQTPATTAFVPKSRRPIAARRRTVESRVDNRVSPGGANLLAGLLLLRRYAGHRHRHLQTRHRRAAEQLLRREAEQPRRLCRSLHAGAVGG